MSEFINKKVAVVGAGRSGLACAEVLTGEGAEVHLYDSKPLADLGEVAATAAALGVTLHAGGGRIDAPGLYCVVTSPGVPVSSTQLQGAVAAGVPVIGEIEAAYRIAKAPIVAITGTNGKTTTTVLVGEMLRASGRKAYIAGNIAAGEIALPLIKAAKEADATDIIVAEISSFQLEWIERFRPRVASILNVSPDHGDRQTWDEYVAAKWRIFENQTEDDLAVLSDELAADPRTHGVRAKIECFGPSEATQIVEQIAPISNIKLPGRHNVENLAAAILMARACGAGEYAMLRVATTFGGVVHRLEYVATIDGVRYINNSMCTNADAFARSLEAIEELKVIIAGGVYKGSDAGPLADAVIANNVRSVVLIGRSAPVIAAALASAGYHAVSRADSIDEAVNEARAAALPGDAVMLAPACASFDMFKDFEDRGDRFKSVVRSLGGQE